MQSAASGTRHVAAIDQDPHAPEARATEGSRALAVEAPVFGAVMRAPDDEPPALPIEALPLPVLRELRSDHAGELGAVWIYRGILAVGRDAELRAFAQHHMEAEEAHLAFFETQLPKRWHTRLAPLWRLAGWLLGAAPAVLGPTAVYRTITAVESFVDHHYALQIDMLEAHPGHAWLRERLQAFRDDELAHRDDAARRALGAAAGASGASAAAGASAATAAARVVRVAGEAHPGQAPGPMARIWMMIVGQGSALGANVARRI